MALSLQGWMNGISVMGVIISFCIFGLFFIYKSKKTDAKLLFYVGLAGIFNGLAWLGHCADFITILLTGNNMDNTNYLIYTMIGTMWVPPTQILLLYISFELIVPKKKWHLISIYLVLGTAFELFLLLDPMGSITYIYPNSPGEDLIISQLIFGSPLFIIYIIFSVSILIFCGFGFMYKSIKSIGIIRIKFLILSIGVIYVMIFSIFDSIMAQGITLVIVRFGVVSGLIFFYFGLREEPEKPDIETLKKEVKVEKSFFRITKRPDKITEMDVSFHIEKKLCLVCKGKLEKHIFLCSNCAVLYCENCVSSLTSQENACWVCNTPFDETKPTKPFELFEEIKPSENHKSSS